MDLRIENLMRKYYARIAEKGELFVQIKKSEVSSKQQCEEINDLTAQLDDRNQTIATLTADLDRALREKELKEGQLIHLHGQMFDTNQVLSEQKQVLAEQFSECRSFKRKLEELQVSSSSRSPAQYGTTSPYHTPL